MKIFNLLIALFILSSNLFGQLQKNLIAFTEIDAYGNVDIELIKSDELRVEAELGDLKEENLKVEVEDGILKIKVTVDVLKDDELAKLKVYFKEVTSIEAKGGADLWCSSKIDFDNITLFAGSGGTIQLRLNANQINTKIISGSTIALEGTAEYHEAIINTNGVLSAFDLETKECKIKTATTGKGKIFVTEKLNALAVTKGYVNYKGSPSKLSVKAKSGGEIVKDEL